MKNQLQTLVVALFVAIGALGLSSCGHPSTETRKAETLNGSVEGLTRRLFGGGRLNLLVHGAHKAQDLSMRDGVDRFAAKESSLYSVMADSLEKFQKQGEPNVWIIQFSTSDGRVLRLTSFRSAAAWKDSGEMVWWSDEDIAQTIRRLYGQEVAPKQQTPAPQPAPQPSPQPETKPIPVPVPVQPVPVPVPAPKAQPQQSPEVPPVPPGFGKVN